MSGSVYENNDHADTIRVHMGDHADTNDSFLADFVPTTDLARGVATLLVGDTKAVAVSLLPEPREREGRIPESQLLRVSEYQSPFDSEVHRGRTRLHSTQQQNSSNLPAGPHTEGHSSTFTQCARDPPTVMATRLPHPEKFNVKEVRMFDGSPSELENFDNSVKQMLLGNYLPVYYGGTVSGNPDDGEYHYVQSLSANSKSNYVLGASLCARLTSRLEKNALTWWQDYDGDGTNPTPNCWRKHGDSPRAVQGSVPEGV